VGEGGGKKVALVVATAAVSFGAGAAVASLLPKLLPWQQRARQMLNRREEDPGPALEPYRGNEEELREADEAREELALEQEDQHRTEAVLLRRLSGHQSLVGVLDCPVCLSEMVLPKIIPCGHSMCATCLMELLQHSSRACAPGASCPLCRVKIVANAASIDLVPTNYALQELLELPSRGASASEFSESAYMLRVRQAREVMRNCSESRSRSGDRAFHGWWSAVSRWFSPSWTAQTETNGGGSLDFDDWDRYVEILKYLGVLVDLIAVVVSLKKIVLAISSEHECNAIHARTDASHSAPGAHRMDTSGFTMRLFGGI